MAGNGNGRVGLGERLAQVMGDVNESVPRRVSHENVTNVQLAIDAVGQIEEFLGFLDILRQRLLHEHVKASIQSR